MNEVEKMYKLANVKAINIAEYGSTYIPNSVEIDGKLYPPFTADKQIELIKWLVHKSILSITIASNNDYHVCGFGWTGDFKADFNEAIASYINNLWQDLTKEERKQIKEILEQWYTK